MVLASVFCNDVNAYYEKLVAGESSITHINRFDASKFLISFGSQIRWFSSEVFNDDCVHYHIVAFKKALESADLGGYSLSKEDYQALKKRKLQEYVGGDTSNGNIDGVEDDIIENDTFERGEDNITAEHGLDHQEKLSAVGWPKKGRIDVVKDDTIENDTFERGGDDITAEHGLDHQNHQSLRPKAKSTSKPTPHQRAATTYLCHPRNHDPAAVEPNHATTHHASPRHRVMSPSHHLTSVCVFLATRSQICARNTATIAARPPSSSTLRFAAPPGNHFAPPLIHHTTATHRIWPSNSPLTRKKQNRELATRPLAVLRANQQCAAQPSRWQPHRLLHLNQTGSVPQATVQPLSKPLLTD